MGKPFKRSSEPRHSTTSMTYDYIVSRRMSGPTTPKTPSKK